MSRRSTPPKGVTVTRTAWGAEVSHNGLTIEAHGKLHQGDVRAAITIRRDSHLLYRDKVNLTSAKSRARFLGQAENKKCPVPEKTLLALDDAIRRYPRPLVETTNPDVHPVSPSVAVITLAALKQQIERYLLLKDPDALEVMLAAVAAHRLSGDPVWLVIVAPPSGVKTELVRLLSGVAGIFPLSELTARTFASGLSPGGEDPSLLHRLKTEILVLKDFTTVLEMHHDERQAILAQLREIYDGRYDKLWGTGKELHWRGRLGFVAGVTPVIDHHYGVMAILGQRFVLLRLQQPDRQAVGLRAMQNARGERQRLRDHLIPMVAGFMQQLPQADPEVSEPQMTTLSKLSNFVTRARSAVQRDGYKRELNYAPEAEMPGRFARQLFSLIRGLAMVAGRSTTSDEDLRRVIRVGLDCLPEVRRLVLKQLAESGRSLTTTELAQQVQYATATMRRALEDCQALELVTCQKGHGGPGAGDRWQLQEAWREPLLDWVQMLSRPPLDFSGTIAPGLPWDAAAEDDAGPPLSEGEASGPSVPVHGHDCLCPECEMSR